MASIKHVQRGEMIGVAHVGAWLWQITSTLPFVVRSIPRAHAIAPSTQRAGEDELFIAALGDPSNTEYDWLWLAAQLSDSHKRRYCFEQALTINPDSTVAQQGLRTR